MKDSKYDSMLAVVTPLGRATMSAVVAPLGEPLCQLQWYPFTPPNDGSATTADTFEGAMVECHYSIHSMCQSVRLVSISWCGSFCQSLTQKKVRCTAEYIFITYSLQDILQKCYMDEYIYYIFFTRHILHILYKTYYIFFTRHITYSLQDILHILYKTYYILYRPGSFSRI